MKLLILGGSGMMGHKLYEVLSSKFDVKVTLRKPFEHYMRFGIFKKQDIISNVDIDDPESVINAIRSSEAEVVINCIGLIKQKKVPDFDVQLLRINSMFPKYLEKVCNENGVKLIQISTDCVFKGDKGDYTENDTPDADDVYGISKYLGEVVSGNSLTLRTSIVGRELESKFGLFEWFLSQKGRKIKGYSKVMYSGLTTRAFARVIAQILKDQKDLTGLYHVVSDKISKYDLLMKMKTKLNLDIEMEKDEEIEIDRSMNGSKFSEKTGIKIPSWDDQIDEFVKLDYPRYNFDKSV